jgi:hypothetical protein
LSSVSVLQQLVPALRRVPADGIELYVDLPRLPEQLEIDLHGRFQRKVGAYWEGCAWGDLIAPRR